MEEVRNRMDKFFSVEFYIDWATLKEFC